MKAIIKIDNTEIVIENDQITVIGAERRKTIKKIVENGSVTEHRKRGYKKPMGSRIWTDGEKTILNNMWRNGDSPKEISLELRRTRQAILVMAGKMGLKPNQETPISNNHRKHTEHRRWNAIEDQQLKEMYHKGTPQPEIARVLNRSYKSIVARITNMKSIGRI